MPDRRIAIAALAGASLTLTSCLDSPLAQTEGTPQVIITPPVVLLEALDETIQLTAEARDENGAAVAGAVFVWESTDASVATVSADGLVTAVTNGTTIVSATTGLTSGGAGVTVTQAPTQVDVSPQDPSIQVSGTVQLTFVLRDANGHPVAGLFPGTWSSSNTSVATVSNTGLVTAVAQGQADITYDITQAEGSTTVTVTP